MERKPITRL
jgi:hypothetical protein